MLDTTTKPNLSNSFQAWYDTAKPGDSFIYYRGHLCCAVPYIYSKSRDTLPIKELTWEYAIQGRIYLVKHKVAEGEFEYIAQKSREKIDKLIPFDYQHDRTYKPRPRRMKYHG